MPYNERLPRSSSVVILVQVFCIGMYIVLVRGLYAPACQSFPPSIPGHASTACPALLKTASGFSVTSPVAPSIPLITFCVIVGRAHRNSPVARSRVYTTPVLPGIPVSTRRRSSGPSAG